MQQSKSQLGALKLSTLASLRFAAVLAVCLVLIAGVFGWRRIVALETQIAALDTRTADVERLTTATDDLQHQLNTIKTIFQRSKLADPPVFPATFSLDGSEKDDPFLGDGTSDFLIMGFSEYQCKPCRDFFMLTFPKIKKTYIDMKKVKYIFRDFPLTSNKNSTSAATLAHCAGEQGKYWELHQLLFNNPSLVDSGDFLTLMTKAEGVDRDKLEHCFKSGKYLNEIKRDIADGKRAGAKGAPGFFVGRKVREGEFQGVFIRGAQPFAVFESRLDDLLTRPSLIETK